MLRTELIRPLTERLRENAVQYGEKTAFADGRRSVTWAELDQRTARVAGHLGELGVAARRPGADLPERLRRGGGDATWPCCGPARSARPSTPDSTDRELGSLLADSKAKAVCTDAAHLAQVCRLRTAFPDLVVVLVDHEEEPAPADCELPVFSALATTEPDRAAARRPRAGRPRVPDLHRRHDRHAARRACSASAT